MHIKCYGRLDLPQKNAYAEFGVYPISLYLAQTFEFFKWGRPKPFCMWAQSFFMATVAVKMQNPLSYRFHSVGTHEYMLTFV
jgi:hypothetical protein